MWRFSEQRQRTRGARRDGGVIVALWLVKTELLFICIMISNSEQLHAVVVFLKSGVAGVGAGEAGIAGFGLGAEIAFAFAGVNLDAIVVGASFKKVILAVPFF